MSFSAQAREQGKIDPMMLILSLFGHTGNSNPPILILTLANTNTSVRLPGILILILTLANTNTNIGPPVMLILILTLANTNTNVRPPEILILPPIRPSHYIHTTLETIFFYISTVHNAQQRKQI